MNRIENLAKGYLTPSLKKSGFKKKKLSWNRNRGSFIDVIEIQESKGSVHGCERFTINIGVFIPSFYELVWNEPYKGFVKEVDCVVRFRLGALLQEDFTGKALDTWWDLEADEDVDKTGVELKSDLEGKVLPFLDSMSDLNHLHDFIDDMAGWQQQYPLMQIYFALIKNSLGDKECSVNILNDLISGKNQAWADRAKKVASALP
ncbi:DUF4304 domain-containing protein [Microbulbifer sp. MLAF003]|uniref:DUF4304 domain-containing protein n=1 Tax=Microbulbifer sp. MLAF003 TaxID=3032582 RepID=UPI0024ADC3FB|nr:DUF4304 domain-containing protein [Microbulbifer sp. MLAF003]WHI49784.1 DUF4304 domain-containing protein [Microbulbifer sp. MLAF003]